MVIIWAMEKRYKIAIIGTSLPSAEEYEIAREVGRDIAREGWILINGGLGGVMEASARGAKEEGGIVVGILPGETASSANAYTDIAIVTGMGEARNVVIVKSSDACIAIGKGFGTLSEMAIALKLGRPLFAISSWEIDGVIQVASPDEALKLIKERLR